MAETPRQPRGQKESSARERLLAAAAELVREVGPGHLTLEAVAERAALSKGGSYHFPSKDALLQGMVERMIEEVAARRRRCAAVSAAARIWRRASASPQP